MTFTATLRPFAETRQRKLPQRTRHYQEVVHSYDNAITGATGQLGRLIIDKLKARVDANQVIALARSSAKASDLGVSVREAGYNSAGALNRELAGIDTLVLISSSEVGRRAAQHRTVVQAAKQNGIQWIIYTSLLHADRSSLSPRGGAPPHVEAELKASGVPATILRNGWYTENYTASLALAVASGTLIGSAGGGGISSAARLNYADSVVKVLKGQGPLGRIYELAGDEAFTLSDLAAEASRQTGKPIRYSDLSEFDYASVLMNAGVPEHAARAYASFDVAASHDALWDDSRELSEWRGRDVVRRQIGGHV